MAWPLRMRATAKRRNGQLRVRKALRAGRILSAVALTPWKDISGKVNVQWLAFFFPKNDNTGKVSVFLLFEIANCPAARIWVEVHTAPYRPTLGIRLSARGLLVFWQR